MIISQRDILAYLSVMEKGNWDQIYERITKKISATPSEIEKVVKKIPSKFVTILDEDYPSQLLNMYKPPFVLYYYGDITWTHMPLYRPIAVVGSRSCSEYGIEATKHIVKEIAGEYPIISGLALGIDAIAAETAIEYGGKTIAVIGSGLNFCYPEENKELYEKIKNTQLLISEYPHGVPSCSDNFPMRNRIIAGIADCVIVTEAGERSGTSITVNFALQVGKNILCVPHPISSNSACNRLIKEGAYLVENAEDIRDSLTPFSRKKYYYGR